MELRRFTKKPILGSNPAWRFFQFWVRGWRLLWVRGWRLLTGYAVGGFSYGYVDGGFSFGTPLAASLTGTRSPVRRWRSGRLHFLTCFHGRCEENIFEGPSIEERFWRKMCRLGVRTQLPRKFFAFPLCHGRIEGVWEARRSAPQKQCYLDRG